MFVSLAFLLNENTILVSGIMTDGEDYVNRKKINVADPRFRDMSHGSRRSSLRGDTLGPTGQQFRDDLLVFCRDEAHHFTAKRASVRDLSHTGTSISGIAPGPAEQYGKHYNPLVEHSKDSPREPFPLRIYTSTMPRAVDTVNWENFTCNQKSNLNPLDKGDFAGMELDEIRELNPEWFRKLEEDPFRTRYVGSASAFAPEICRFSSLTRCSILPSCLGSLEGKVIKI